MSKKTRRVASRKSRSEYDFRGGERGKYARRYAEGANVVVVAADLVDLFPDSESVNRALRACADIVRSANGGTGSR